MKQQTQNAPIVWKQAMRTLEPLHSRLACSDYITARETLGIGREYVPWKELDSRLREFGFTLKRVRDMIGTKDYLTALAQREMPCIPHMRKTPLFAQMPDYLHDAIGHVPFATMPGMCELFELLSRNAERLNPTELEQRKLLLWFCIEVITIKKGREIQALGAAIVSSAQEMGNMETAPCAPFDFEVVLRQPMNYQRIQDGYWYVSTIEELVDNVKRGLRI